MQMTACRIWLAVLALLFLEVRAVTPLGKVIQLLTDMQAKGDAAKKEEATKFSAFSQWCADQKRIKTNEIQAAGEQMDLLKAQIHKQSVHIQRLTDRILELEEDVGRWEKDTKSASDVRGKEKEDFQATQADFTESIDALTEAIAVLKKQAEKTPQASFVQVQQVLQRVRHLPQVPQASKHALAAFLQQSQPNVEELADPQLDISAPEAYGYEFQSGGVVDMLNKLLDKFSKQKYDLEHDELVAQHAFEQIAQILADNIENAKHEISKKTTERANVQKAKAEAEGDLAETTAEQAEDQKYLDDTVALCHVKAADFESRQNLRAQELEAIAQAIEILSSETVSGAGDKHLPSLLQQRVGHRALAQLRNDGATNPVQARISAFLADRARSCDSRVLALMSERVASNPFVKVKKMIKDLISKLMMESTAEIEHKGWCDSELVVNKLTRERKTDQVNQLTAESEDLSAQIEQLALDIADLSAGVKELTAAMAQASAERAASKQANTQTIEEAKEAQAALTKAIAIVRDFYAQSVQATSLSQQTPAEDAPETFDKPYQGMLPEGQNVADFLEVILTDFTRLESETATSEAMETESHKKFMFESEKSKALKENAIGHKSDSKLEKESALHAATEELKATQDQLDKAVAYYEKLKPTCVDSGITYEERVRRREEEIQSLQEALKILKGTDVDLA